jgi:hypothetical protein
MNRRAFVAGLGAALAAPLAAVAQPAMMMPRIGVLLTLSSAAEDGAIGIPAKVPHASVSFLDVLRYLVSSGLRLRA